MDRARGTCERQERGVQGFGGKTRGKKPLGRPRHRGAEIVKMDVHKLGWVGIGWIDPVMIGTGDGR